MRSTPSTASRSTTNKVAWRPRQPRYYGRQVTAREVFTALGGEKRSDGGFMCRCPCGLHKHGDHHPSLSVKDGRDGRLLLFCFAGGDYRDVAAALRARGLRL
jgi:hypothetical protein